jgi:hypothetical protein
VSCATVTNCVAVGSSTNSSGASVTLAEQWNGSSWSVQTTPNPSAALDSYLSSVSCAAATSCTAVGQYLNQSGATLNLVENYAN